MIKELFQKLLKVSSTSHEQLSEEELKNIYDRYSWSIYESCHYYLASKEEGQKMLDRIFARVRKELVKGDLNSQDFQITRIVSEEINARWKELGTVPDKSGLRNSPFAIKPATKNFSQ